MRFQVTASVTVRPDCDGVQASAMRIAPVAPPFTGQRRRGSIRLAGMKQATRPLRRGWTSGTRAAAASRAAYQALITGAFPDPVPVLLPNRARPMFALAATGRGADFARAGVVRDAGATGATSESAVARMHGLPERALIHMGDFVDRMAKMSKLGQGLLDLHSRRGEVDLEWVAARAGELAARVRQSNSAMEAFGHARDAGIDLPASVAKAARDTAARALGGGVLLEVVVFDRTGGFLAGSGFRAAH